MSGLNFTPNQKLAMIAIIGLMAIGLSYVHIRNSWNSSSDEIVLHEPSQGGTAEVDTAGSDAMPGSDRNAGYVVVHVAGCVKAPGVYSLSSSKRVIDAVKTAGGAKPDADLQALNLAERLEDGSKIVVPSVSDKLVAMRTNVSASTSARMTSSSSSKSSSEKLSTPGEGVVHINSASVDELQRLPGVGPSTAQKILDYRSSIGRFTSPEQMLDVKGIGPKKFEKMRPFVAL